MIDHMVTSRLMISASVLAILAAPGAALAQQAPAAAPSEAAPNQEVGDIIVTAQKRGERLQNVPISISVLGGADLDSRPSQGVREALNTVPGIVINQDQNGTPNISMRGVAATGSTLYGSSVVGYYLDSAPFAEIRGSLVPDTAAFDLDRVEVLKGPQGTLYGSSSLNGVVRIITKEADLNNFDFKIHGLTSATDGGGQNYRGDAMVNIPIIDGKLAIRVVGTEQDLSGWIDKPNQKNANNLTGSNLRLRVDAKPTDEFSIDAFAWFSRIKTGAPNISNQAEQRTTTFSEPGDDNFDVYGLKLTYDLPLFTITSMTTHLTSQSDSAIDVAAYGVPGATFNKNTRSRMTTEEVLLNSNTNGPWKWTLGGIYRDAKDIDYLYLPQYNNLVINDFTDTSQSYAFYGEITRKMFGDRLEATAGLRYFKDNAHVVQRAPGPGRAQSATFDATTPRFVLTWHQSPALTIYASYSQGFRSGLLQASVSATLIAAGFAPPVTKPDKLTNYEIGAKGNIFDHLIDFDASVYYIDWRDPPQNKTTIVTVGPATYSTAVLVNGPNVSGVGADLALTMHPTKRLTLSAAISWNGLGLDSDRLSGGLLELQKGMRNINSPETTFAGSAAYAFPLGGGFNAQLSMSANYTSEIRTSFLDDANAQLTDPIWLTRANLTVLAPKNWTAAVFIENALNNYGKVNTLNRPAPYADEFNVRNRPRTIGVELNYHFR